MKIKYYLQGVLILFIGLIAVLIVQSFVVISHSNSEEPIENKMPIEEQDYNENSDEGMLALLN